jgi:hypothetical protein
MTLPEKASTRLKPARAANAASDRQQPLWDQDTRSWAAPNGSRAGLGEQDRHCPGGEFSELGLVRAQFGVPVRARDDFLISKSSWISTCANSSRYPAGDDAPVRRASPAQGQRP